MNISTSARRLLDVGIDVGGTFTDVVMIGDDGSIEVAKDLSTPHDQSLGAVDAAGRLSAPLSAVRTIVHGTTVATNAILERRGARLALVTTRGFRDVLELQRQERSNIWDLYIRKVVPLVPRHLRLEVDERIAADGSVVEALDEEQLVAIAEDLRANDVEAVAISFINAYANPHNEIAAERRLRDRLGDCYIVRSSAVAPHFREYERTSTTTISGYVGPRVSNYLDRFAGRFAEQCFAGGIFVMGSNGGILPIEVMSAHAATTCLSGPAGGILAAQRLAREKGTANLISFDMGGTSTDVCIVRDGTAVVSTQFQIDGLPITLPVFAIETVSAGGGSIAALDAGGMLRVGPESAGSAPGPACYGQGGKHPTVTDALCLLGLLTPENFFGGKMRLSRSAAAAAFRPLADSMSEDVEAVAGMTVRLANVKMANAVRLVTAREGHDPRDFALVAYGGAGPLHACSVAEEIGVDHVIIPRFPGAFSALGLLSANLRRDYLCSWPKRLSTVSVDLLKAEFRKLRSAAAPEVAAISGGRRLTWEYFADVRYVGQASELMVPLGDLDDADLTVLAERFHGLHAAKFGYDERDAELEVMTLRLLTSAVVEPGTLPALPRRREGAVAIEHRHVQLPNTDSVGFVDRAELLAGDAIGGPAVVAEPTATTYVPPGWRLMVDDQGHLDLTRRRTG